MNDYCPGLLIIGGLELCYLVVDVGVPQRQPDVTQLKARFNRVGNGWTERQVARDERGRADVKDKRRHRSEEHTSELQSRENLVCRLLLEKKKKKKRTT